MRAALDQAWPAFVLVAGLLLCARVAAEEQVLAAAAARLERTPGGPRALLVAAMALVFLVTAVLNLDTAATFLTPVLVLAARRRGADERPFLYAAVVMANASSLALPGANLTNLIVFERAPVSGAAYLARDGPMALAAALATALGLLAVFWPRLRSRGRRSEPRPSPTPGVFGLAITVAAALAVLVLRRPAIEVLVLGVAAVGVLVARGRLAAGAALRIVDLRVLGALFVLALAAGTLARAIGDPAGLRHAGELRTTLTGVLGAVLLNNLPAASLLSAGPVAHRSALLLGLGVGPNLAVTGSLSVYLWWRAAETVGVRPSVVELSRLGVVLVPLALGAGLLALSLS